MADNLPSIPVWPGNSKDCRYAGDMLHQCRRRDGRIIVAGEVCFTEAAAQIDELRRETAEMRARETA